MDTNTLKDWVGPRAGLDMMEKKIIFASVLYRIPIHRSSALYPRLTELARSLLFLRHVRSLYFPGVVRHCCFKRPVLFCCYFLLFRCLAVHNTPPFIELKKNGL